MDGDSILDGIISLVIIRSEEITSISFYLNIFEMFYPEYDGFLYQGRPMYIKEY